MRQIDLTFRIIKMGRHTVSIAVCALTGMIMMGGAMAATVVVNANTNINTDPAPGLNNGPAISFEGNNVSPVATVGQNVNLTASSDGLVVAVANNTTGSSFPSLVLSGNNTVTGSVAANFVTINSGGRTGTNTVVGGNFDPYVIGAGATISGKVSTSSTTGVTVNGETAAALNGGLNGNLTLTGYIGAPAGFHPTVTINSSASGSSIGTISTATNQTGIVNFTGTGTATVVKAGEGINGVPSAELNQVNVTGGTVTFTGTSNTDKQYAYINTLNVSNGATVNLNGGMTGNISNAGTVALESSKNIFGDSITGGGTLNLLGNNEIYGTVSQGTVNAASNVIFDRTVNATNVNVSGTNVLFSGLVTSGNFGFTAGGTATLARGLDGNVNFNGNNATLTLEPDQTITGSVDTTANNSGILAFRGVGNVSGNIGATGSLKEIQANSTGLVTIGGSTRANTVNMNAAGTVAFTGGLDTRYGDNTLGAVNFFNSPGTIQMGANSSLIGNVITGTNNNGTVTMVSGNQSITGAIGSSTHALNRLNIGGANTGTGLDTSAAAFSSTTANGNVFANSVMLNNNGIINDSTLAMASGYSLTGTVATDTNHAGILTLAGGTQTVTGTVGADDARLKNINSAANGGVSTFTANVFADNVINTGNGSSTFDANVTATTLVDVGSGATVIKGTTLVDGVGAEIRIGTGTGSFNTVSGTTTTGNMNFTGAGTANLNQGLTFTNINFAGHDATINLASGKDLTGTAITTTTNGTGFINLQGGTQTVSAAVGAANLGLNKITAGLDGATSNFTNGAAVHANTLEVVGNGAVNLSGGLVGNLSYINNVAGENATVTIGVGKDLIGTVTTGSNGVNNAGHQGLLTLQGGSQTVSGPVGAAGAALKTISAGATGGTSIFSGMVHAEALNYSGNGTVALNGTNGGAAAGGLIGNVDLNNGTGTLRIGNGVNLTTGNTGIEVANAHNATLTFAGSSTVTGVVGGDTAGRSTFRTINAGAEGSTVTFTNDVYVSEAAIPTTFHVTETGTVNFQGDLHGQLVFNAGGDGVVNVSHGKSLLVTLPGPAARAVTSGQGSINFLGSAVTAADLGESGSLLKAIHFNSTAMANGTATLSSNLYATNINIGGNTAATYTGNQAFGGAMALTAATSSLDLGGHTITGAAGASAFNLGTGTLKTTLTASRDENGSLHVTGFGNISANTASNSPDAKVVVTMPVGNWVMEDGDKFKLVDAATGTGAHTLNAGNVTTNSAVISYTALAGNHDGSTLLTSTETGGEDLWLIAHRVEGDYASLVDVPLSLPGGAAGERLTDIANGVIGAVAGATSDMRLVLSTFDSYSLAQMEPEVRRLAPIANASTAQSAIAANSMTLNTLSTRLAVLRGDSRMASYNGETGISTGDAAANKGAWLKGFGSWGKQDAKDGFDGYKTRTGGLVLGADTEAGRGIVGAALSYADTKVDQQDFRAGDSAKVKSFQLTAYATQDFGQGYLDGMLSYAQHRYDSHRATALGRTAVGDYDGSQVAAKIGGGYRMALQDKTVLTPLASLEWTRVRQDAYTETGADALNLVVDAKTTSRTRASLGARLSSEMTSGATVYRPEIHALWSHDYGNRNTDTTAAYAGGGAAFTTTGLTLPRNSFNLGFGVTLMSSKSTSVQMLYDLEKRSGFTGHTGQVTARYSF